MMVRIGRLAILGAAVTLVACAAPVAPQSVRQPPMRSSQPASHSPRPLVAVEDVDIGGGQTLHLECSGDGSPTVLLESGAEAGINQWDKVFADLAETSRTCRYDRAGIGASSPPSGCRGLSQLTGDLSKLLTAADVPGPYVLVATSGGGFIAAEFAREHAVDVAGIVLLDVPGLSDPQPSFPPELVERLACEHPLNIERLDYLGVERDAWDRRADIGDIPAIVSNDYGDNAVAPEEAENVEAQRGWLVLSPRSTQVLVTSGHDIPNFASDVVAEEVSKVLEHANEP